MFIRPCYRNKNGKRHAYWTLVESYRTDRGPRQRVVAYLGGLDESGRLGVKEAAEERPPSRSTQLKLFSEESCPSRYVEVDISRVRVENSREFGASWLAWELIRRLGLDRFLKETIPTGREGVPWSLMAFVLVAARLCRPSSELYVAEHFCRHSGLADLLGVPASKVNESRLYRTLDALLPHKRALEVFLKNRLGELFELDYDLLLYDITSTYFEGEARGNSLAQRGYSRDKRPDCKQVCIALVVSRCGMPLGYEVFAGNRTDVTTVEEVVTEMESRYGRSKRIWVMDRGMVSEDNIEFLKKGHRRYIVGTPKEMLQQFEQHLLQDDWHTVRAGVEVKLCPDPDGSDELFILCRSQARRAKDEAIVRRFEKRLEERLTRMTARCGRQKRDPLKVAQELGRLLGKNSRAARLFDVQVASAEDGRATLHWEKNASHRDWATLSAGCYLLRSNVTDWSDEELWRAYIQLTEAEAAFRIHKSDLSLRPVWHQKKERVLAHILVCFLAYVLWKTLGQLCQRAGLGHEPRRVLDELSEIRVIDVVLPTREGIEIRKRCITQPTEHQAILMHQLGLELPPAPRTVSPM